MLVRRTPLPQPKTPEKVELPKKEVKKQNKNKIKNEKPKKDILYVSDDWEPITTLPVNVVPDSTTNTVEPEPATEPAMSAKQLTDLQKKYNGIGVVGTHPELNRFKAKIKELGNTSVGKELLKMIINWNLITK